jgi:hypothetical protein
MAQNRKPIVSRAATRVSERGHIYFFYRPRGDAKAAKGLDDVQGVYLVLSPRGKDCYRLLIIGEKRLPAVADGGDRKSWAFVEKVSDRAEEIEDELDPHTSVTKTGGERRQPAARPAGEGVYGIVRHRDHTHMAYVLELPAEPDEVQRALNIVEEGSYIVAVKNPQLPPAPGTGLDARRRATFSKPLQSRFRGRRLIPLDPPEFLDQEGTEILMIGVGQNIFEELGVALTPEREAKATAYIFRDLNIEKSVHPLEPLFKGEWI